jgi:hypothetical protein
MEIDRGAIQANFKKQLQAFLLPIVNKISITEITFSIPAIIVALFCNYIPPSLYILRLTVMPSFIIYINNNFQMARVLMYFVSETVWLTFIYQSLTGTNSTAITLYVSILILLAKMLVAVSTS